ncbi:MAG: S8 family serine peptidase [Bacteroidota bacterium]
MKKIRTFILLSVLILTTATSWGQMYYWVGFSDKLNTPYSTGFPEEYLSERAIERRETQNIPIDSLDLPLDPEYVHQVLQLGAVHIHSSKWLNGITVASESDDFEEKVQKLPFVTEVQLTKKVSRIKSAVNKFAEPVVPENKLSIDTTFYGGSVYQVGQLNGQFLHNQNFRGQGMQIAVLDAGFYKANQYSAFDSLWANNQILGIRDFVSDEYDIFEMHYHGMSVLSIMGGNQPGELIGTAPKASYWLFRTEDTYSENIIEEDNWVAAAEYADSLGVDIINSSLGYSLFDDSTMNHTYADMDGNTTRVTRGANIAASRGMLVFSSAGNEGSVNNSWKYIIAPSDGDGVIGVGAANRDGAPAPFTSYGPASDGDVKPNVSAVGWNTILQKSNGTIGTGNGTSYSSPVIAGAAACLWQANPNASALQVKSAIEQSAHLFHNPDSLLGYGIPDMKMADQILKISVLEQLETYGDWLVYPNPMNDYLVLQKKSKSISSEIRISFYTTDGRLIYNVNKPDASKIMMNKLQFLPSGMLLLQIVSGESAETVKIYKSP